jgi:hypothetical protein
MLHAALVCTCMNIDAYDSPPPKPTCRDVQTPQQSIDSITSRLQVVIALRAACLRFKHALSLVWTGGALQNVVSLEMSRILCAKIRIVRQFVYAISASSGLFADTTRTTHDLTSRGRRSTFRRNSGRGTATVVDDSADQYKFESLCVVRHDNGRFLVAGCGTSYVRLIMSLIRQGHDRRATSAPEVRKNHPQRFVDFCRWVPRVYRKGKYTAPLGCTQSRGPLFERYLNTRSRTGILP